MIVADASAMVVALVGSEPDDVIWGLLGGEVAAPHLLDVEVFSALRGLVVGNKLTAAAAERALDDYFDLAIVRYDVAAVARRVWDLRHRYTAYDATYLALAEGLASPLLTYDAKLAAGGHHAELILLG